MAAIPKGVKPKTKCFVMYDMPDLVLEVNMFVSSNKSYEFIDITYYPKMVPSGTVCATIIYYEPSQSIEQPAKVLQQQ